ncbi:hypothetical protein GO730_27505 [Spirosoma sp. HMF3257]|uniref:Uncharacterized protein n=1 Tax=Spirosoma telluris TaxID=2183553 RepID=A0A327NQH6_9BACT|nr:hypothetical protein [Spirosoma telluris]RAI76975.1 hypothetical protein HMF3257_27425 [Spirosoma telluris]
MRTLLMKKVAGYLATASLVACPFVSSVTAAMPSQTTFIAPATSTSPTKSEAKLTGDPVLVRNTTAKSEAPATTSPAKVQDKKTIGRCWKRLMNMAREVTHAHHTKK